MTIPFKGADTIRETSCLVRRRIREGLLGGDNDHFNSVTDRIAYANYYDPDRIGTPNLLSDWIWWSWAHEPAIPYGLRFLTLMADSPRLCAELNLIPIRMPQRDLRGTSKRGISEEQTAQCSTIFWLGACRLYKNYFTIQPERSQEDFDHFTAYLEAWNETIWDPHINVFNVFDATKLRGPLSGPEDTIEIPVLVPGIPYTPECLTNYGWSPSATYNGYNPGHLWSSWYEVCSKRGLDYAAILPPGALGNLYQRSSDDYKQRLFRAASQPPPTPLHPMYQGYITQKMKALTDVTSV